MLHTIHGKCYCGNLSFELSTDIDMSEIQASACHCSFCHLHDARNWSDPKGSITIRVASEDQLQRYRFGMKTADFYICRICGSYIGAVLTDSDGIWSMVNLRFTQLTVPERAVSYSSEDVSKRVARQKKCGHLRLLSTVSNRNQQL